MLCWSTHLGSSYARSAMGSEEAYVLSEEDHGWMDYAHSLAEETLRSGEVPVACVIVHGGKVLSQGNNETIITRNPTRHAEMVAFDALDQLGSQDSRKAMLRDSVLYVTCEPCIMCSAAVRQIGVPKVIYGCKNDRFGGCGSVLPVNLDSRIGTGRSFTAYSCPLAAQKAVAILKEFYKQENPNGGCIAGYRIHVCSWIPMHGFDWAQQFSLIERAGLWLMAFSDARKKSES